MNKFTLSLIGLALISQNVFSSKLDRASDLAQRAADVIEERMESLDQAIPEFILKRAECIAVFPNIKSAGFTIGGSTGKGLVSCRDEDNNFGAAAVIQVAKGSYGFQVGFQSVSQILVFTGRNARESFVNPEIQLGASAGLTLGPVGRNADAGGSVDLDSAQIVYSYSASKGLYGGVKIESGVIRGKRRYNEELYETGRINEILKERDSAEAVNIFTESLNEADAKIAEKEQRNKSIDVIELDDDILVEVEGN